MPTRAQPGAARIAQAISSRSIRVIGLSEQKQNICASRLLRYIACAAAWSDPRQPAEVLAGLIAGPAWFRSACVEGCRRDSLAGCCLSFSCCPLFLPARASSARPPPCGMGTARSGAPKGRASACPELPPAKWTAAAVQAILVPGLTRRPRAIIWHRLSAHPLARIPPAMSWSMALRCAALQKVGQVATGRRPFACRRALVTSPAPWYAMAMLRAGTNTGERTAATELAGSRSAWHRLPASGHRFYATPVRYCEDGS